MKKGRKAELSGMEQTIITLRDVEKLSWGKIDARLNLSKGSAATYYRRGKRVLAAREAAQRDWERNESHRFSEGAWWRLSRSLRKRHADRAPYSPEVMATLSKPKRSRDDRPWDRADNPLLTAEEKTETQTPSESLSPATSVPTTPLRVAEPVTPPAPVTPQVSQRPPEPPSALPAPIQSSRLVTAPVPKPAAATANTPPKAQAVFAWPEDDVMGQQIYRDPRGNPVELEQGTGPRKSKFFVKVSNETQELVIARIFAIGEHANRQWYARMNGKVFLLDTENPAEWESRDEYMGWLAIHVLEKRPRRSWLPITGVVREVALSTTPAKTLATDRIAEVSRLQREMRNSPSIGDEVMARMRGKDEGRQPEEPKVDLSDPDDFENIYFNGLGFNKPLK